MITWYQVYEIFHLFIVLTYFLSYFEVPGIYYLRPSLPPIRILIRSRKSDPESHSRLFCPPPYYGSCLAFLSREDLSSFFPRRLASNCAYPR